MQLSIVIPTLNEEHQLPVLLDSLFRCTPHELDIIVVDGLSKDRTCEVVTRYQQLVPPAISLTLLTSEMRGIATQRNLGAQRARHNLILFLDADTAVPSPQVLETFVKTFQAKSCSVASCRFAPLEKNWRSKLYYSGLYVFHKTMERISPYALGATILTTKKTFQDCHGFDDTLFINEDANYCARASVFGRFKILPVTFLTSSRRFIKEGYLRMTWRYLYIFLDRTFRGEMHKPRVSYRFGHYYD